MKLSIIVPVFNEEKTIQKVLERLAAVEFPSVTKEVIIVDDNSSDSSSKIIQSFLANHKKKFILKKHNKNQGKGAAVRTGISYATGEYIIIQDADLEYNPEDIGKLLKKLSQVKKGVIYGTRLKRLPHFTQEEKTSQFLLHYLGNKFLSLLTSILYGQWVTDMETCYKLFPKNAVEEMQFRSTGFEFEPELTAKLIKKKYVIYEVPIKTIPRGYNEGKKLHTVRDGLKALGTLFFYRIFD